MDMSDMAGVHQLHGVPHVCIADMCMRTLGEHHWNGTAYARLHALLAWHALLAGRYRCIMIHMHHCSGNAHAS